MLHAKGFTIKFYALLNNLLDFSHGLTMFKNKQGFYFVPLKQAFPQAALSPAFAQRPCPASGQNGFVIVPLWATLEEVFMLKAAKYSSPSSN